MESEKSHSQPTIEIIYHWLLRIGAWATCLFAIQKIIFYLSVFSLPYDPEKKLFFYYMCAAVANAVINTYVWWKLKEQPYSPNSGFMVISLNLVFILSYFVFNLLIYDTFFTVLIVSALVAICVTAGLVCHLRQMILVSISCGLIFLSLFLLAQNSGIPLDPSMKPFILNLFLFFLVLTELIGYVSQKMQAGERAWRTSSEKLEKLNLQLETAHGILCRYVAPQLATKILNGDADEIAVHSRRKLTLFFSDIKDFTATTDSMEAEDLVVLLNSYLNEMLKIAIDFGGTVAQISGDGLFIFFGAPECTDDRDHALQCVRMAVSMQNCMGKLEKQWFESGIEHPFRIRCGINTGVATVGGFGSKGRKEYTAIGMQVNLAARLEAACEPGRILISHTTWGLIKDDIPCIEKDCIEVKGFHRPIRTYQIALTSESAPETPEKK